MKLHRRILRKTRGESGATFLEYAMLCALIGIVVSIAVSSLGVSLNKLFGTVTGKVDTVNSAMGGGGTP